MAFSFSLLACCFWIVHGLAEHAFVLQGGQVSAADAGDDFLHLDLELGVDFLQLRVQLRDFGIRVAELSTELRDLDLEVGLLLAHFSMSPEVEVPGAGGPAAAAAVSGSPDWARR